MSFYRLAFAVTAMGFLLSGCNDTDTNFPAPGDKQPKESKSEQGVDNLKTLRQQLSARTLKVGMSLDNPPMSFSQNGQAAGFEVDLIHEIGNKLDCPIEIVDMPFDGLLASLKSNLSDCVISDLDITPQRQEQVDFSIPYYESRPCLACPKALNVNNINELAGLTIGAQEGTTYIKTLIQEVKALPTIQGNLAIKELPKFVELIKEMENGRISCIIGNKSPIDLLVKKSPNLKKISFPDNLSTRLAIAFPKGSPLVKGFDAAIDLLKANGTLKKLQDKWGLTNE